MGCPKKHSLSEDIVLPAAVMLMETLLTHALPHCDPHGVGAGIFLVLETSNKNICKYNAPCVNLALYMLMNSILDLNILYLNFLDLDFLEEEGEKAIQKVFTMVLSVVKLGDNFTTNIRIAITSSGSH